MQKRSPPQPQRIRDYLYKVNGVAIANGRYRRAINVFEHYRRRYAFTDNQEYRLGLLYDHLAMNNKKSRQAATYLKKAEGIYQRLRKRNPKNFFALYGLGRVYRIRGNSKKALRYQIRAYRMMLKLPRKRRGALAIGVNYELMGDKKNAERWYKREYEDTGGDFGTTLNLFSFYRKQGDYYKAARLLPRLEKLLTAEYRRKQIYGGTNIKRSKFVKSVQKAIVEVKRVLTKSTFTKS